jgi:hypothetical protein
MATSPSKMHQKIRWITGASVLPPAVMVSITSEPESDEVTKKTITSVMPMNEVIAVERQRLEHHEERQLGHVGAPLGHAGVAIVDELPDRGAAEGGHPQDRDRGRDEQHADDELAHRAAAR